MQGKDLGEWLLHELYIAYLEARKNKRGTSDEHTFELNAMQNLVMLRDDIINHRYKPGRGIAFIIYDPVMREIFAAPFRDRVVHHFLYNQNAKWWDERFIYDSYSCRVGKGTLFGVKRMQKHVRQVSRNGTRKAYVLKFDIQGYFMSLSRKRIFERVCWGLERQYDAKHEWLKNLVRGLWAEVIFDDPTKGVRIRGSMKEWDGLPDNKSLFCQPPGQGIVIGNLSSQLVSNIYLDQLDRFVTFELGWKHYGRYVDDFYLVVTEEEFKRALSDVPKISEFLISIGLTLHPRKRYIQEVSHGTPFLGMVVYPYMIVPGRRFKNNFHHAAMEYTMGFLDDDSMISYLGYMKNVNGKKICKKMFDLAGFEYRF
ncbi:RNA-directed DNA polymerase [Candidatus Saccharibacteria bacterium]|nr:RNA-directed DNA polymerase [Candidatus Saccharibacteria bacterium]